MYKLRKTIMFLILTFLTACGTGENSTPITSDSRFDMWEYMTSTQSYEVEYDVYENNIKTDFYVETHKQFGSKYERESSAGLTTLTLRSNAILMDEPNENINVVRFLYLDDENIFQSPNIQNCRLENFYENYENRDLLFHNVLQVTCHLNSGDSQEIYYGYNEGIVAIVEKSSNLKTEYVKVGERQIN